MSDVPEEESLYIPPEKLNDNVKRMAWLLFLEAYKARVQGNISGKLTVAWDGKAVYEDCLENAKLVWHEQEKGYERA